MKKRSFGIIGTGIIAGKFTAACHRAKTAAPLAVGSRSLESAQAFAKEHQIERAYGSHVELLNDPDIDVIYVAVPTSFHFEIAMLALQAGKHVLCEKPFCIFKSDAEKLMAFARSKNLFIMEGLWTRFLPTIRQARQWIAEGRIGTPRFVDMEYTIALDLEHAKPRMIKKELGGGAVLDLGVYTLSVASCLLGANPVDYRVLGQAGEEGVDLAAVMALTYPGNVLATMRVGFLSGDTAGAMGRICGDKGLIELPRFFCCNHARLVIGGEPVEACHAEYDVAEGFVYQIEAVSEAISRGGIEQEWMPHEDTVTMTGILEDMMNQLFPGFSKY